MKIRVNFPIEIEVSDHAMRVFGVTNRTDLKRAIKDAAEDAMIDYLEKARIDILINGECSE